MRFTFVLLVSFLSFFTLIHPRDAVADDSSKDNTLAYLKGKEKMLNGDYEAAAKYLEEALKSDTESAQIRYELSEVYLRLNRLDRAEALAKNAVEKDPNNANFRMAYGAILASNKKYTEAKQEYGKVMEIEPSNQKVPLLLAMIDAEDGKFEESIKVLTGLVDANPDNVMALFYRAKIYLEMEQLENAKADLEKALSARPSFVEAGTTLGMIYERLGEVDQAISAYSRIQGSGRFKKRLAQLYLQKNEFDKALNELVEYEKAEPDDYTVKVKIGLIYYESKKYAEAIQQFEKILKEQPAAANVRFYLGVVFEESERWDKALSEFKKVDTDSSFFKEAMLHSGFIYKEKNRIKEGLEFSAKVLKTHKDVVEFYDMYASFFEAQKEYKRALGIIADGLKRFPKDEKLLYFEGALLDRSGQRERAIANMKKIIEANANNAHALNFLGYTYAEMGTQLDMAEEYIKKALSLRPNDGYIEDSLAWVEFKKGKADQALEHLEKAASLQPEEPIIFEHFGDVYAQKKDFTKAAENYTKARMLSQKRDKDMARKIENKLAALEKEKRLPSSK